MMQISERAMAVLVWLEPGSENGDSAMEAFMKIWEQICRADHETGQRFRSRENVFPIPIVQALLEVHGSSASGLFRKLLQTMKSFSSAEIGAYLGPV
jgi:hypothetical protein